MSYLLREVLLGALGIDSDLKWGIDDGEFSAINLELVPPSAGSLVKRIQELGSLFQHIESLASEQQSNPYHQALSDSIENFLDKYRSYIFKLDENITSGLLTTLTGLVASLESYQTELRYFEPVLRNLMTSPPLVLLNKLHEHAVVAPPSIASTLAVFEHAIQSVAISQITGYLFYNQKLPELFQVLDDARVVFHHSLKVTFIPYQLAEHLILMINIGFKSPNLLDECDPPEFDNFPQYIISLSRLMSDILAEKLSQQWPPLHRTLHHLILAQRSDYVTQIARKLMNPFVTAYDLNGVLSHFEPKFSCSFDYSAEGAKLKLKLSSPLSLIVTPHHEAMLNDIFQVMMSIVISETAISDIWHIAQSKKVLFRFLSLTQQVFHALHEHLTFVVIFPVLEILEKKEVGDFLKFNTQFTMFMTSLVGNLPVALIKQPLQEIAKSLVELSVACKDSMGSEQINEELDGVGKVLKDGMMKVMDGLRVNQEQGVFLGNRLKKLLACIEQNVSK